MATMLARLGRWAFRRRYPVIAAWVVLIAMVATAAAMFSGPTNNNFTLPGTESQQAIDTLSARFPVASGSTASIVFAPPAGQKVTDAPVEAAINDVITATQQLPHVIKSPKPSAETIAPDGSLAVAQVRYDVKTGELGAQDRTALTDAAAAGRAAGLTVAFSGELVSGGNVGVSATEGIGILVAFLVLIITFGSLAAAGMPLLTGVVGVAVGLGGVTALSGVVTLTSTAPILALMLGLAVGIDYSLFIVSRHRSQLAKGMTPEDSTALAVGTAGSAVVFAGLTVIIALAGLSVVGIPFLTVMGLVAATTVLVTVLVALTLIPAMLGVAGARLVPKPGSRAGRRETQVSTMGQRWVGVVTRHPVAILLIGVLGLGVLALPVQSLRLGLPSAGTAAPESTQRQAYDLIATHLGAGVNGPLSIVVDTAGTGANGGQAAAAVATQLKTVSPDVAVVSPPRPAPSGNLAVISLIPKSAPDSEATTELVQTIRKAAPNLGKAANASVQVTGPTALAIDVSDGLSSALPRFLLVVVGLALLLLGLVFRSIVVPIKAAAGFLLTVGASLGAVVAVFQWGWLGGLVGVSTPGPIISFLPVLLVGILFGLAMDYEVFLVSRMREDFVHGSDAVDAVRSGFRAGSRVVTAAALIMISVFAGFVLAEDPIIKSIGFALALGILIDAFVVRMTLVPAVLTLFGKRAWWLPRWLDKVLPRADIEGEQLQQELRTSVEEVPVDRSEVPVG